MIDYTLTPRKPGDRGGILCLPLIRNLGDPAEVVARHPDWQIVSCPRCEADCYMGDDHRQTMSQDSSIEALCTECALRAGMGVRK